jgi:hypothetical protein
MSYIVELLLTSTRPKRLNALIFGSIFEDSQLHAFIKTKHGLIIEIPLLKKNLKSNYLKKIN